MWHKYNISANQWFKEILESICTHISENLGW